MVKFLDSGLAEDMCAMSLHLMNDSMPMHYTSGAITLISSYFLEYPNRFDQLPASAFSKHHLLFLSYDFRTIDVEIFKTLMLFHCGISNYFNVLKMMLVFMLVYLLIYLNGNNNPINGFRLAATHH